MKDAAKAQFVRDIVEDWVGKDDPKAIQETVHHWVELGNPKHRRASKRHSGSRANTFMLETNEENDEKKESPS